jgi:hypothetical protein
MGCADGGTSIDMVRQATAAVRARWSRRSIWVVYADQPRNDYNSLFNLVHGLTPILTYLDEIEDVHVLASASGFYRPIVPAGTLDLGFSATAMHWLSRKPCDLTNHVQAVGAEGAELAAFAEQGRRDWEAILLQRAQEMAPGARLVLVNFCKDEAGRYLGNTNGVNMFDTFNVLWQRFASEGIVSSEEYLGMTFPQYYRTVGEFTQPLIDTASAVYRAGLRLEHSETHVVPARSLLNSASTATLSVLHANISRRCGRGLRARFSVRSRRAGRSMNVELLSIATMVPMTRWCVRTQWATPWTMSTTT